VGEGKPAKLLGFVIEKLVDLVGETASTCKKLVGFGHIGVERVIGSGETRTRNREPRALVLEVV
jgi:hypothetical protein